MIELMLTCFPVFIRIAYLRFRRLPVTFYNIHRAFFIWLVLFFVLIFTVEYYHPDTRSAVVPFRVVPIVAKQSGTVTAIYVKPGQKVKQGDILFSLDDKNQRAEVERIQAEIAEINSQIDIAKLEVAAAEADLLASKSQLQESQIQLRIQKDLKAQNSAAFASDRLKRAQDRFDAQAALVSGAQAALEIAKLTLNEALPAKRVTTEATLKAAQVKLDETQVVAQVAGSVEQVTLFVGARASQVALNPSMVIVPDLPEDSPLEVVAGFSQVVGTVLHVGMPAEIACYANISSSMKNALFPARIVRIQKSIATGQLVPSGTLLKPSSINGPGELVVHFALVHQENQEMLVEGSSCLAQAYSTEVQGNLQGTLLGEVIQAWAVEKALIMRMKVWATLIVGAGLFGGDK